MPVRASDDVDAVPSLDWLMEIDENRHSALQRLWEAYQLGDYEVASSCSPKENLELIPPLSLTVDITRDATTGRATGLSVRNLDAGDRQGVNFMGYDRHGRCLAFRGEARHLDAFLDFAHGLVKDQHIESALKTPSDVRFPRHGIEAGLDYDKFAGRVEIVEYAMWITEPQDNQEGADTMTIISVMRDGEEVAQSADKEQPYLAVSSEERRDQHKGFEGIAINDIRDEDPPRDTSPCKKPSSTTTLKSQLESDAAIAAALSAEPLTRYPLRVRAHTGEATTPSPEKLPPRKAPRRKKGIAQKMNPRCR